MKKRKSTGKRPAHNQKVSNKGRKSMRGVPEYYDQVKQVYSFSITPDAHRGIDELSKARGISMSELIERMGRRILKLVEHHEVADT